MSRRVWSVLVVFAALVGAPFSHAQSEDDLLPVEQAFS